MPAVQENLQHVLYEELNKIPHRFLKDLITKKLDTFKISSEDVVSKLVEHVLAGNTENLTWDNGGSDTQDITISITDEDIAGIKLELDKFLEEGLPSVIKTVSEKSATDLLASLKKRWPEQHAWEAATIASFRKNLEVRWGKGLDLLRLLLSICLEIGAENVRKHKRSKRRREAHLSEVIIRLHARACQVSAEIIALMESGFADGAMARWRTLHEIGVVATVISDFGEETARRYVAHQVIEAKAAMDEYARSSVALGYEAIPKRLASKIAKDYERALEKYGKEFASPYGWAAENLKKKKPIFPDLEAAAGRALMRSHYRMASYNVHASSRGAFFRLSLLDSSGIIAGASNAGLAEPGQNTAFTLTLVTTLLYGPRWKFDDIVALQVLSRLRDEIPSAFLRAERKLQRDDALYKKQIKAKRKK